MQRSLRKCVLAVGAALGAVALGATSSAWAHPFWTITGPSANLTAVSGANVGNVTFTDTTLGTPVTCSVASATGTLKIGTGLANPLASISTLSFGGAPAPNADKCNGLAGIKVQITIDPSSLPLTLHVLAHSSPTADAVTGELRGSGIGIRASYNWTDGCQATLGGPNADGAGGVLPVTLTNSMDRLTTTTGGNLRILTVNGSCDPDLIKPGDLMSLAGTFGLNRNLTVTD